MIQNIPITNILFLDIETVPTTSSFDDLPPALKELWQKKSEKINKDQEMSPEELFFEKAGIYSEFGKIVCISAGVFYYADNTLNFRCKAFYNDDESIILKDFAQLLNKSFNTDKHYLCGHNAREFDFPYIARRMLINQIQLPRILNIPGKKPWEVSFLDTMDLWKFGDYKNYTSLALLAAVFNIPTPKDDIAGNDVARVYWKENDLNRIAVYCNKDVVTTARVYLKYNLMGELDDENITSIV